MIRSLGITEEVLIESDWNLKVHGCSKRNRSRSINRIRLEFKESSGSGIDTSDAVLIESDWNLKDIRCRRNCNDDEWY